MEVRIAQEEREPEAKPGAAVEEIAEEESPEPEAEGEPVSGAEEVDRKGEPEEPGDRGDEESIESIVEDLKRERGQS
jgi:hypothetical protein